MATKEPNYKIAAVSRLVGLALNFKEDSVSEADTYESWKAFYDLRKEIHGLMRADTDTLKIFPQQLLDLVKVYLSSEKAKSKSEFYAELMPELVELGLVSA